MKTAPAATRPGFEIASNWLIVFMVVVTFSVSTMTLSALGIKYDEAGGNFLHKLHPATWFAALALGAKILSRRDLGGYLRSLSERLPGVVYFTSTWVMIVAYAAIVQQAPMMPLVDTFFSGVAFFVVYSDVDEATKRRIQLFLHVLLFVNACVGVAEFVTHTRLTPFVAGGKVILHDYRSTAILGHPLINSSTAAAYVLILFFGGDKSIPWGLRILLIGVQLAALATFGGRTAIIACFVLAAVGSLRPIASVIAGKQFDMTKALIVALALPVVATALGAAFFGGYFDEFFDRFVSDKGSAYSRVVMFQLFDDFSLEELLLGPDRSRLTSLMHLYGIEYGIENTWLGLVFQYGLLMSALFVTGFFALLWEVWKRVDRGGSMLLIFLLVQVSAAAGLGVKSVLFNQFIILLLATMEVPTPMKRVATFPRRDYRGALRSAVS